MMKEILSVPHNTLLVSRLQESKIGVADMKKNSEGEINMRSVRSVIIQQYRRGLVILLFCGVGFSLVAEGFTDIDWTKPKLDIGVGYLLGGGNSLDSFLNDVENAYGGSSDFNKGKGGLSVNIDALWDMGFKPEAESSTDPGRFYAGVGIGFLQAARASWKGYDPVYWSSSWGDYVCSYYVIPIEVRGKYYFLIEGLFIKAGLGIGIENISYNFKSSRYELNDDDDKWDASTRVTDSGTGVGFVADIGIGYEYEILKNMFVGGGLDMYCYRGRVSLLNVNPRITFSYNF